MEILLGTTLDVWICITLVLTGGASYMTGQAIARTWRPLWQVVAYSLLLAVASRFFVYALFDGNMLLASGYVIDAAVLMVIGLLAFRINQVQMMVNQYPWLYERAGPFGYRAR
jgi:EamA domain-containing membrane protein RarD